LPGKYFDSAGKNRYAILQTALHNSPHPIIISKNPGFRPFHPSRRNEFLFCV